MSASIRQLRAVLELMREHMVDSVELPNGLKVHKSVHVAPHVAEDEEPQVAVNFGEHSGRLPIPDEEILFAASQARPLATEDFSPYPRAQESDRPLSIEDLRPPEDE